MKDLLFVVIITLGLLEGCGQQAVTADREKVIAIIQKAEAAQADALAKHDLDAAVAVFAEDGRLYAPGLPPAFGREAIKAVNELSLKDLALNVAIDEASRKWWVSSSGDLATTTYTYAWTHTDVTTGKPETDKVVSQTTWARQADGSWKNVLDLNLVYPTMHSPV